MMKPLPGAPPEVRIARREAKAMLAAGGWRPDPELSKVIGLECFQSDRGQAMILMPGKRSGANLCEDRAALLRYSLAERARPPEHMLEGLFPCGESFPAEISKLIDQLAVDTGIARSDLDGTEESLLRVERAFSRRGGRRAFLTPERFPEVVAYTGEVLRQYIGGGTWKMELAYGQWEPWIVGADGSRYPVFILAHDGLEQRRVGAILGMLQGELVGEFLVRSSARRDNSN